jgi:methylmalonyl-CoA/ethylmalonyl-CoA epimerase
MSQAQFNNEVQLHHVGYVVRSIPQEAETFARSLALDWDGKIIHDPLQTVYVSFFHPTVDGNPTIELVEPEDNGSAVHKFLQRGGGLHHLCYEVASLEKQLEWTKQNRDLIVRRPVPAVAFSGRRIAWVYTRSKLLLEYLERCHK